MKFQKWYGREYFSIFAEERQSIMYMKKILTAALAAMVCVFAQAKQVKIFSPDKTISVTVTDKDGKICYTAYKDGKELFSQTDLCVVLSDRTIGENAKISAVRRMSEDRIIRPVVPMKHAEIHDVYNGAVISFKGFKLEFRVMDNAVAYRFITAVDGEMEVMYESFNFAPCFKATAHYQTAGSFRTSYEELYRHQDLKEWKAEDPMATLPIVFSSRKEDLHLLVSESDLRDYAGMFVKSSGKNEGIESVFPPCPLEWEMDGDRAYKFTKEAPYIAKTEGTRSLPWRYVVISDSKGLIEQTLTAQLGGDCQIEASWVKGGQVAWDWWNWKQIYGEGVDFEPGCNTDTYKYFIDFASKFGIDWIILDEGWAKTVYDPFTANDNLNLQELVAYGKSKGVGLVLWLTWTSVQDNLDKLFETYEKWGIAGVKVDFMDRSDQWMVNYYERVVAEAAKHHILVDFHGAYKPSGLEQRYPNLLSYEGVRGMEYKKNCPIDNTVYIPFIRNAVGPADFTPGAMITMQPERYMCKFPNATWYGTRAFTMALYIVLESGIQMLSDSPTRYYQNEECTRFISDIPVSWDETRCVAAEFGKYVVVAKRHGSKWFVGGIMGDDVKERTIEIPLDFLNNGTYKMTSFSDGFNAGVQAMDYRKKEQNVRGGDTLSIRMCRNGGFAAVIE